MTDVTVTNVGDLTTITGANVATTDRLVLDDASAGELKSLTVAEHLLYLTSALPFAVDTVTATDASYSLDNTLQVIWINDATDSVDINLTFASAIPAGSIVVIGAEDNGAISHTVTLSGSQTYDGTNNIATFDAPNESITIMGIDSNRVLVLANVGGVAFSV